MTTARETIRLTLHIDGLLAVRTDAHAQYDRARETLHAAHDVVDAVLPRIDERDFVWVYDVDSEGHPIPRTTEAPAWSWDVWRAAARELGTHEALLDDVESRVRAKSPLITVLSAPRSPGHGAELYRFEFERATILAGFDLDDALEEQRLREWSAYGAALERRIGHAAALLPGVAVVIALDTASGRGTVDYEPGPRAALAALVENALTNVSSPADLAGTPLDRLREHVGVIDAPADVMLQWARVLVDAR